MPVMERGVQFEVLYRDNDLVKVGVSAWNGAFGGRADVYLGTSRLAEVATQLRGFPKGVSDTRQFMLGTFDPESAGGGVNMRVYCVDRAGHAYVEMKIQSDRDSEGRIQSAMLVVPIVGSGVDSFVDELRSLDTGSAAIAHLRATVEID